MKTLELERKVVDHLDSLFSRGYHMGLLEICPQVENTLLELVKVFVLGEIKLIAEESGVKFQPVAGISHSAFQLLSLQYFLLDSHQYEMRLTEHPTQRGILVVAVQHTDPEQAELHRKFEKTKFQSLGRYTEVHLIMDKAILSYQDAIGEIARTVLDVGYHRMEEYIDTAVHNNMKDNTGEALYTHVRRVFAGSPDLVAHIWLYIEVEDHGIYTMDHKHRELTRERTAQHTRRTSESPIANAVRLFTERTSFPLTYSGKAIADGETKEGALSTADYIASGIQIAEEAIYQCDLHACQPLVRQGRNMLTACYPANLRNRIEPVLYREREEFKEILENEVSSIRKIVKQFKDQGMLHGVPPKLAELMGAFLKSLILNQ